MDFTHKNVSDKILKRIQPFRKREKKEKIK